MSLEANFKIGLSSADKQKMSNDIYSKVDSNITTEFNKMNNTIQGLGGLKPSGVALSSTILAFTENKYEELSVKISDPSIMANQVEWRKLCKEHVSTDSGRWLREVTGGM